jgi:hypothetical protein
MVLGLFEDKNKDTPQVEAESAPENPYAKKPDHVRAALNEGAKGAAIGGVIGTLFFGQTIPGMIIGSAIMGGVGINAENNRVKYDEVTLQTDAKQESNHHNLNWLAGGTIGTALALSGVGLIAIPAAVAAGWAVDNMVRGEIETDIQNKQAMLATQEASASYDAGIMDASAMQLNGVRRRSSNNMAPLTKIVPESVVSVQPAFGGSEIGQGFQSTVQSQSDQKQFAEAAR